MRILPLQMKWGLTSSRYSSDDLSVQWSFQYVTASLMDVHQLHPRLQQLETTVRPSRSIQLQGWINKDGVEGSCLPYIQRCFELYAEHLRCHSHPDRSRRNHSNNFYSRLLLFFVR